MNIIPQVPSLFEKEMTKGHRMAYDRKADHGTREQVRCPYN